MVETGALGRKAARPGGPEREMSVPLLCIARDAAGQNQDCGGGGVPHDPGQEVCGAGHQGVQAEPAVGVLEVQVPDEGNGVEPASEELGQKPRSQDTQPGH